MVNKLYPIPNTEPKSSEKGKASTVVINGQRHQLEEAIRPFIGLGGATP